MTEVFDQLAFYSNLRACLSVVIIAIAITVTGSLIAVFVAAESAENFKRACVALQISVLLLIASVCTVLCVPASSDIVFRAFAEQVQKEGSTKCVPEAFLPLYKKAVAALEGESRNAKAID